MHRYLPPEKWCCMRHMGPTKCQGGTPASRGDALVAFTFRKRVRSRIGRVRAVPGQPDPGWGMRVLVAGVYLLALLGVSGQGRSDQDDFQLLLPENNVSSKPFVEFRARTDSLTGHAFVAIGQELDNGLVYYSEVAGFYPKNDGTWKARLYQITGPGEVTFKMTDWRHDYTFRVPVTVEQKRNVENIIGYWDFETFSLPTQNCVTMVNDIASALGLRVGNSLTPRGAIEDLKANNQPSAALSNAKQHAAEVANQRNAINAAQSQRNADNIRRQIEIQKTNSLMQGILPVLIESGAPPDWEGGITTTVPPPGPK